MNKKIWGIGKNPNSRNGFKVGHLSYLTEESKKKLSKSLKLAYISGRKKARSGELEIRQKISLTNKKKGILPPSRKGKKHTKETKEKMRQSRFRYAREKNSIIYPTIGRNEKETLDELEKKLGYRIIRQYEVGGYYLDGYISEINLAIEIDEKYHKKRKKKDIQREEFIKQKLGCRFLRIKDYH